MSDPIGTYCLVLHSHLPWLANHGTWPVGEEWLHQSWAHSYQPVVEVLERLAAEGRRDLLTLGVTPVLAAQLDDPACLRAHHTWLGFWQARAAGLAASSTGQLREAASAEFTAASRAIEVFESSWIYGGSPVLRGLADSGAVELLGGPAAHPFQPLLPDPLVNFSLRTGLDDSRARFGVAPVGIWAPECGYRPGLERLYAEQGVEHFLVDGPTLLGAGKSTADAWSVGDSDVIAFGRDLDVTYRVWSPTSGYPGGEFYRDFHTFDHDSGLKTSRVTSHQTPSHRKAVYDAPAASAAALADARDFVDVVRRRLTDLRAARDGRPGLVVTAYDTELFGHWWHEGPQWLEHVLRLLPKAGVHVTTLAGARAAGHVAGPAELSSGSWGSGKDWRVWDGAAVSELARDNAALAQRLQHLLAVPTRERDLSRDQLARTALLALASDWAFMVTKDSAAQYALERHHQHHATFNALADALVFAPIQPSLTQSDPTQLTTRGQLTDYPFAHLDSRLFP